jgi:hypothetical protein
MDPEPKVETLPILLLLFLLSNLRSRSSESSVFIHPTNPSSTTSPLPDFQSAIKRRLHVSRRVPGGRVSEEMVGDEKVEDVGVVGLGDWIEICIWRRVGGVGAREQMMRPHNRQWCLRFDKEKTDLSAIEVSTTLKWKNNSTYWHIRHFLTSPSSSHLTIACSAASLISAIPLHV